jgi:acetyl-CoA acetyltransferase
MAGFSQAYVIDTVRTAVGKRNGSLASTSIQALSTT